MAKMVNSGSSKTLLTVLFNLLLLSGLAVTAPKSYSIPIAQQPEIPSKEKSTEAEQLSDEGMQLSRQGTAAYLRQAVEKWEQALLLFKAEGDQEQEAFTLLSIGAAYTHLGEKQKALDYFNQSLPLFKAVDDHKGEITTLNNIGVIYNDLGEKQKALEYCNQSLAISRAVGDRFGEADTLHNLGRVYSDLGEKRKALDYFQQVLPLYKALGDRSREATTLNNIGRVYSDLGENQKALDSFNQSLPLARAVDDHRQEATALNNIGLVYSDLGEKQKALDSFNQSLAISRAIGDRFGEADTLHNLGRVYSDLGEKRKALDYFQQVLPLYKALGDRSREATTLNNIGLVYSDLGEKQKALDSFNQSLAISTIGDRFGEARTFNNIGLVYSDLGEKQKALDHYNQSLPLARSVGDRFGEAYTLNNIGLVYSDWGKKQEALDHYNQSLLLFKMTENHTGKALTLNNIGAVYYDLGEKQKGLEYYNQSLPLSKAVGDRAGEARTLNNIGLVYSDWGEKQKALDSFNQSLRISKAIGYRSGEAGTLFNIASLERDRGNLQQALISIQTSINIIENLRTKIASPELRTSYFASVQGYYQFYIDLLMQLHQQQPNKKYHLTALEVSERARARTLIELLNEKDIDQGIDPQLKQIKDNLLQQLAAKTQSQQQILVSNPNQAQKEAINQELNQIQSQLQNLDAEIRTKNPDYARLTQVDLSLKAPQIQQKLVDDNTILLSYWLGEERSYLWLVTSDAITSYQLPPKAEIAKAANEYLKYATNATELRKYPKKANAANLKLSQMLLSPVVQQLGQKRLIIIGDGILQYLPFNALVTPQSEKPLIGQHEIINLPSASTLDAIRAKVSKRQMASKQIAILADPVFNSQDERLQKQQPQAATKNQQSSNLVSTENISNLKRSRAATEAGFQFDRLPGTQKEAQQILALVPETSAKKLALGFDANRTFATSPQLSEYRLVHLATHGFYNQEKPEFSGIVLSRFDRTGKEQKDGVLLVNDIFNLNLPTELVVLSACRTVAGKDVKGEGIVGLTRGLIYAGARRALVSLWKVDDEATAAFMGRFYQEMLVNKQTPSAALRKTQLWMQTESNWREPEYWAAFVLQGEW